jgi:hypothetical protein
MIFILNLTRQFYFKCGGGKKYFDDDLLKLLGSLNINLSTSQRFYFRLVFYSDVVQVANPLGGGKHKMFCMYMSLGKNNSVGFRNNDEFSIN